MYMINTYHWLTTKYSIQDNNRHHSISPFLISADINESCGMACAPPPPTMLHITPIVLNIVKKTSYNRHHPHFCFQFSVFCCLFSVICFLFSVFCFPFPVLLHITPIVLNIVLYHTIGIILVSVFHFPFLFSIFCFLFFVFCFPFSGFW